MAPLPVSFLRSRCCRDATSAQEPAADGGRPIHDPAKRVTLKKLVRLCTPVGVNGGSTKWTGRNVLNDLDAGTLDATKEDVRCLPALLMP
jgi:hypothetical protein